MPNALREQNFAGSSGRAVGDGPAFRLPQAPAGHGRAPWVRAALRSATRLSLTIPARPPMQAAPRTPTMSVGSSATARTPSIESEPASATSNPAARA